MIVFDQETRSFSVVESSNEMPLGIYFDEQTRKFAATPTTKGVDWKSIGNKALELGKKAGKVGGNAIHKGTNAAGFALRNSNKKQWATVGAGVNMLRVNKKRNELESKYINQGMDPSEAKKRAKKEAGGMVGAAVKGAAAGTAAKIGANTLGFTPKASDLRLHNMNLRKQIANKKHVNYLNATNKALNKQLRNT